MFGALSKNIIQLPSIPGVPAEANSLLPKSEATIGSQVSSMQDGEYQLHLLIESGK